jgi:hypothetical protein
MANPLMACVVVKMNGTGRVKLFFCGSIKCYKWGLVSKRRDKRTARLKKVAADVSRL